MFRRPNAVPRKSFLSSTPSSASSSRAVRNMPARPARRLWCRGRPVAHVLAANTPITSALPPGAALSRQSVNLDRSTLADRVGNAAFLLQPIHQRLFERLKASDKLFADATTAPVLDRGAAAPGRYSCSPMHAMMPHRAVSNRPALPISICPIVRPNSHSGICWTSSGSYSSTAMPMSPLTATHG